MEASNVGLHTSDLRLTLLRQATDFQTGSHKHANTICNGDAFFNIGVLDFGLISQHKKKKDY